MNLKHIAMLGSALGLQKNKMNDSAEEVKLAGLKKANSNVIAYSRKYRSQWFKPEYDFKTLAVAEHTDAIMLRSIKKKADRILVSGFELVGNSDDPVQYIKNRIKQIELVTGKPFDILIRETFGDLFRQNNSMWAKVRNSDSSSGKKRVDFSGKELEPVAGYFLLPFTDLEFKTNMSGGFKKIKQTSSDGTEREFSPSDVIHFYTDKKAGFTVGTPELLPALDDIALLRRIEEQVEELIETNLFPSYHYKIGSDQFPERMSKDGQTESEIVKRSIEYMPAGSVYVSDHRHEITAIGSEGKALTIESYLDYFLKRAISSAGGTEIDLGFAGTANRSTSQTLSKSMMMDIEAVQKVMTIFINHEVINELLLEGGYDLMDEANQVEIRFGVIDHEERMHLENQQIQLFTNNVRNLDEVRKVLGDKPTDEAWLDKTFFKLFEEPLAMIKASAQPGSTGSETLAGLPQSNITPEAVNKGKTNAIKIAKATKPAGAPGSKKAASGSRKASAAKSRPSNQHGTRTGPKTNRDYYLNHGNQTATVSLKQDIDDETWERWAKLVTDRADMMMPLGIQLQDIANNMIYRLTK